MAIRDLLWACPLCGLQGGLRPDRKGETCSGCGARFRRARGAIIEASTRDGRTTRRSATDWAAALPAAPAPEFPADGILRRDRVQVRFAEREDPVYRAGEFIGAVERFGPVRPGDLMLEEAALSLRLDDGEERRWPLDTVQALQVSSGSVQIRPPRGSVVAFRFPNSSARLWEESIAAALRARYRATGRGEVVEFQPRIVAR